MSEPVRRAVIIGSNCAPEPGSTALRHAEADAALIFSTLTDPKTGTFDAANVDLIVGNDATAQKVKRQLRRRARETKNDDVLLVYYSGHGLSPRWSRSREVYLATDGLPWEALVDEPDSGLRMSFLRRDVFPDISGISILILDACMSGAYANGDLTSAGSPLPYAGSHAALMACSDNAVTRENDETGHGEFTYRLNQGLLGEARNFGGDVTFDSLYTWLHQFNDVGDTLTDSRNWKVVVTLTRPSLREDASRTSKPPARLASVTTIGHPLQAKLGDIKDFMNVLTASLPMGSSGPSRDAHRLSLVRAAIGASAVGVVSLDAEQVRPMRWTDKTALNNSFADIRALGESARSHQRQSIATVGRTSDGRILYLVLIGRRSAEKIEAFIAIEPTLDVEATGEMLAVLIRAYLSPDGDHSTRASALNLTLLTALRDNFGRLPFELYEQAHREYRTELRRLVVVFEPVVRLVNNGGVGGIISFEALAREDYEATRAPGRLLQLADRWGDRFTVTRDTILANTAINRYGQLHTNQRSFRAPLPVSINVAVRSLFADSYKDSLRQALRASPLEGAVTLEISERDPIELPRGMSRSVSPTDAFRARLGLLGGELDIKFAVDDFGVGHSSLDRVSQLSLTAIKIDRVILEHPLVARELALVVEIAKQGLAAGHSDARSVVLEGLDSEILSPLKGEPRITLKQIYGAGIRAIQGYITGPAFTHNLTADEDRMFAQMKKYWDGEPT